MKTLLGSIFLTLLVVGIPTTVSADGLPDSRSESVCSDLLDPGVSEGLFATCYAYCEIQDCDSSPDDQPGACNGLLNAYNSIADEDDPPMPCLEAACPCWTEDQLAEAGLLAPPFFCTDLPPPPTPGDVHYDGALYLHFDPTDPASFAAFGFENDLVPSNGSVGDPLGCEYNKVTSEGPIEIIEATTPAQNQACRDDIHALFLADFGGTEEDPHQGCL